MAEVQHKDIPDAELHEPKGAAGASVNTVYVADGAGSGSWQAFTNGTVIGFADYNDATTSTTPINVTADTETYLTNDASGAFTNTTYLQAGLSANSLWDTNTQKFDWSAAGLQLGDMVDIRLDIEVTTTSANQDFEISLELATDSGSYDIPFDRGIVKTAGATNVNRYNGVYMGDSNTLTNKARFKILTDAAATVVVRGWYVKVITNR